MYLKNLPIRKKLLRVILFTSCVVLLVTSSAFFAYEFYTFRRSTVQQLSTLGEIIASNSTAPLAFDDPDAAAEILASLKAEKHIMAACIYTHSGEILAYYPETLDIKTLPSSPGSPGFQYYDQYLEGFQPIIQGERTLGTLYMKSDMKAMYERFGLYAFIAGSVIIISFIIAVLISRRLQHRIAQPILDLAQTAKAVSEHNDYSVRAIKHGDDEVGMFTDVFNNMLAQIQNQNQAILESAAHVNAVLNSALSAVVVSDAAGVITEWNARAEQIFGWTRAEAIGKVAVETIVPVRQRNVHVHAIKSYLETGKGAIVNQLIESTALRRDGTEFPVELSISPLRTGNAVVFCGFITDITERKKAEEEIRMFNQQLELKVRERTEELESVNKELESFSYSVSHDLRAPLRSIHGYMNILAEDYAGKFDDEAQRLMTIILNNAKKMGQLIDDLLEFSRLGRKGLTRSIVSMKEMAAGIFEDLVQTFPDREVEFRLDDIPNAYVDHNTFRQVWINLIGNALKYSRNKTKTVIHIGSELKDGNVVFFIRDNGAGFDMLYYDKLFGVFQRLHATHEFEGTGVGLAIVHRIIAKHRGNIWAEGEIEKGATFYFTVSGNE